MSLLQDLLALNLRPVAENQDEWEAANAAQAEEHHSRVPSVRDMMVANIDRRIAHDREVTTQELAFADEFSVEHDSDDMVHLLDGERSVRVSMPYHTWVELCQETVHKHAVR